MSDDYQFDPTEFSDLYTDYKHPDDYYYSMRAKYNEVRLPGVWCLFKDSGEGTEDMIRVFATMDAAMEAFDVVCIHPGTDAFMHSLGIMDMKEHATQSWAATPMTREDTEAILGTDLEMDWAFDRHEDFVKTYMIFMWNPMTEEHERLSLRFITLEE